jgi:sugar phosphate isomerase/epimerase
MKLGIGTYAYMWSIGFSGAKPAKPMTALDLLSKARELGVGVVQYGPNRPLDRLPEAELEALVRQAREWEIELEVGTRGFDTEHLRRQIALTRRVGATLLRTVSEAGDGPIPSMAEFAAPLKSILPELESAGVKLAIENARIPSAEMRRVLDSLHSPCVGITLDTVNSLAIPEGWEEVTRNLAPYTFCLHVKDFVVQRVWHMMGFTVEGRPAGQGQLDLARLLEILRAAEVSPNAILELWVPEQKTLAETVFLEQTWVEQSIPFLRQYIRD